MWFNFGGQLDTECMVLFEVDSYIKVLNDLTRVVPDLLIQCNMLLLLKRHCQDFNLGYLRSVTPLHT